ncbi:DnaD domain-containing protein [Ornithinibacillus halophilus]|uniref:DNA replication protein DnaD n=1 Tax=Ornithinibacillus halophilus TaxID=930117 RepID=A0A1M5CMU8_9BACI|nr:DnaD domain-containing protein [Ornithinibacillus halophilus]SHF56030.1 DNA replication protein DnaD [Ornithinibacillus halophilus]
MKKLQTFQHILLNQLSIPIQLLTSYTKLGLNEIELLVIIHIHRFQNERNMFPTPTELASSMTIDEKECSKVLRKLVQKGFLNIEQMENDLQQLSEAYSLQPLWEKVYSEVEEEPEQLEGTLFVLFEQEFGRPLSPFEIETINTWLDEDQISPALIKAGLRESVLMGKLNFKYIDRILREWKNKGIHTVEQARNASRKFHDKVQQNQKKENQPKRDTSFYYNWLEGEDS